MGPRVVELVAGVIDQIEVAEGRPKVGRFVEVFTSEKLPWATTPRHSRFPDRERR
ncbi:MAG TPA: hypothetical protein VD978_07905 [Azospirillum sp.]|nr:hypothetical protein [Azospirillum sp.]